MLCVDFGMCQASNFASDPTVRRERIPEVTMKANIRNHAAASSAHNAGGLTPARLAASRALSLACLLPVVVFALGAPGPAFADCMPSSTVHSSAGVHAPTNVNVGVHSPAATPPASNAPATGCPVAPTVGTAHVARASAAAFQVSPKLKSVASIPRVNAVSRLEHPQAAKAARPSRHRP